MWLLLVFAAVLAGYVWMRWSSYSANLPPGPFNIPLLGSWEYIKLYLWGGSMAEMYVRLGARYGPIIFQRIAMDTPVVAIRTYDAIKEASKNALLAGMTLPYTYKICGNWKMLGISFSDGAHWQNNRTFLMKTLGKMSYESKRLENLVNSECNLTVNYLLSNKGEPVDFEDKLVIASINSLLEIVMSRRFELDDAQLVRMRHDIYDMSNILANVQTYLDFLPWLSVLFGKQSDDKRLERIFKNMYDFIDDEIINHQENLGPENEEPRDIIEAYLLFIATQKVGENSIVDLRVFVKDLLIGGLEAPNILLTWVLMLLASHPKVQERVHAEIDAVVGPDRTPSANDEKSCPYIHAVLDETLRYATLTPFNRHFTSQGATKLMGYHIPANSVIMVDQHSLHHDPAVWGDPDRFRPERFLEDPRMREHVRGFGFSPRVCPAEKYARTMLFLFVTGLFQKLKLRVPDSESCVVEKKVIFATKPQHTVAIVGPR